MKLRQEINLGKISYFRVGGEAKYFVEINSESDFAELAEFIANNSIENIFVLGAGSNVLVSDQGFDGLVIKNNWQDWQCTGNSCWISAGAMLPLVAYDLAKKGLSGLERLAGIPGTVGGAIRGNAEANKQSISDYMSEVIWLDWKEGIKKFSKKECQFVYRGSVFKSELTGKGIIVKALFKFEKADSKIMIEEIKLERKRRELSYPKKPSCGCFFKNIFLSRSTYQKIAKGLGKKYLEQRKVGDMFSAGLILDLLGLKGKCVGGACVSKKHANFIINKQNATAQDIYNLYILLKNTVKDELDIDLEPEVQFCGKFK